MSIKGIFPIDKWNFRRESILAGLPEGDLKGLMAHRLEQVYGKGEVIFREGGFPQGIFFIVEGKIKKFKVDSAGREQIIYVANTGELMGYHAVLSEERYPDSAAALEKSRVAFIPKEDFLDILDRSPVLSRRLLKTLSHEFGVLANAVSLFAQKPARQRLALQLIVLREKYKVDFSPGMPVTITLSRDDLASLVGATRESVVRMLTELKEEGILETKGRKIIVHDVNKLIRIADFH
ncbi:Crp/Fnr family transcriptional regulator [Chitinophaga rhizosphaerae]|uniref:Crp/Fnr family transcriptional regulator n=1 Tax=Chitinophaga rhizosphaerae TaxID=1864947 RepID=UPI000F7FF3A1|nr:Crp/Fnr family transcriptional regulator [Chitinophaga rhizosphaerae]